MPARTRRRATALVALALAVAGVGLVGSTAQAAPVVLSLCAQAGTTTLPGEVAAVPIWGFGVPTTPGDCSTATPSLPGPVLTVTEGDTVTLTVTNALPAGTAEVPHALRIEAPGIAFDPGPTDAAVGATVSRTFTASAPGTYLYQSGGDGGRQEAMGLYGALLVRPATAGQAYDDPATAYDVEAVLVLSAVDPAFNAAPDTSDLHGYDATSWLIGGQPYPATAPIVAAAGQRVLLRYVNAGFDNTSMALLGMHQHVVARDARPLTQPVDVTAETIPAGATEDTLATVPTTPPPGPNGFPLYNRQLHVTNGPQTGTSPTPATGGGMLTFIHP
ncbi:hypothetical protein Cch01nite_20590 [Cellulomonas chitinilytica]|uniref:Plastocyanin-like domain-containing protein n=1 Tax=Cellulomonas chitinilytica TaxID=398759 RepID=A0A919TZ52_9CELL|nr:multicopper oxidase domain-containing protein [Cellulomonas chitinilytica]GIG21335.1 hypothetical protein Cch01nite_20590 [Cellulomonas chitinilytica]